MQLIRDNKMIDLLPDVQALFAAKPDYMTIQILGELGGRQQLEAILNKIPELVDLDARKAVPTSTINVAGPEYAHDFDYALIVEALGRLGTPAAISQIKAAGIDFNPQVRYAACKAIARLTPENIDADIRRLVAQRLSDSPEYVAEAARMAAEHIGVSLPPPTVKPEDTSH